MARFVKSYDSSFLAVKNDSSEPVTAELLAMSVLEIERRRFSDSPLVALNNDGTVRAIEPEFLSSDIPLALEPSSLKLRPSEKAKVRLRLTTTEPGMHAFRIVVKTATSTDSCDVMLSVVSDALVCVDRHKLRFKFHVCPPDTAATIPRPASPRGCLGENVMSKSVTLLNQLERKLEFEVSTDNPCFTSTSTRTELLPTEVTRIKVQFKPDKASLAQTKQDDPLLQGYKRHVTNVCANLVIQFASGVSQRIPISADIIRPHVSLVDMPDKLDFGFTHVDYPLHHKFTLVNRSSAKGMWTIEHVARENSKRSSPATRTVVEQETLQADDAGFDVFNFDKVSGYIRGPSRTCRMWPAPTPTLAYHADSADFDPVCIRVSFIPKNPGYVQSRFRLVCGEFTQEFTLCGCSSKEEADARRLTTGLLTSLA